jgi:PKD repeat protein
MLKFRNWLLVGACCAFVATANAQAINKSYWEDVSAPVLLKGVEHIKAEKFRTISISTAQLKNELIGVKHRDDKSKGKDVFIEIPFPDSGSQTYQVFENNTMHPDLKAKFPEIRSYDAIGENGDFAKIDITPHGFHAMILSRSKGSIFIDPYSMGDTDNYKVYFKKDFTTDKHMNCGLLSNILLGKKKVNVTENKQFGTCELRTYRFAVSATGEYTAFHGGTVALAQAAQVTTMNRVNGLYERSMALTLTIIGNNNLIVFTNAGTDPFTNGTPGSMINENQTEVDGTIGSGNYDIGHVFGTNSGGLAGLGVVCSGGNKARGVTGSSAPVGDPFDIDYVAHETGHQFGANHTQNNNCNRNNATAMEPGSASTIMGYAGICAPDVQSNSDDHFHGISLEEIHNEITSHGCPVTTVLANAAPAITATNGNVTVPANTPFALTANCTDADGDPLYYCWEQMDNAAATMPPVATSTDGPNFRSNSPVLDSTRYFPNLIDLAAGITPTWEVVPSVTRTMNFRVVVRDQPIGVIGCNDHADVTVTTDAGSGPFIVTYPSATGITWAGNGTETVTWNVANTDNAPVACAFVDILLSTDGGVTYSTVLATNVPNDGSETITVPNVGTTTARIMVICSNGTFFDISDNDFEITIITTDYTLSIINPSISVCPPNDAVFNIDIGSFGGYIDPVTLSATGVPAGATGTFALTPVTPADTTTFTVSNTGSAAPGTYTIVIQGNSTTGIKTQNAMLTIAGPVPSVSVLATPADATIGVTMPVNFTWSAAGPGDFYDIDIATDIGFASIVDNAVGLATNSYNSSSLSPGTTYYWRVRVYNACGDAGYSSTFMFETVNEIILPPTGTLSVQTTCTGILFDSGGGAGNYGDNEDSEVTISPTGASSVDLTFISFDIEAGSAGNCDYDWIEIYDGPTTASPLIDRYCNDNIPTTISSTLGSVTIVFHSDGGVNELGFQMNWQCVLSSVAPTAGFSSDIDSTCIGSINFNDESLNGPTSWAWDFGDGNSSTAQNPMHTYTTNGTFSVMLTATNGFGNDILTITNMIYVNMPVVPTTTGDQVCGSGILNLSATGTGTLDWYDSISGGTLVNTGTTFTTPVLAVPTTYYVQAAVPQSSAFGAKPDNSGGGNNFDNDQHLKFDAYTPFEIVSVEVVANGGGNRTIELRDNTGAVLSTLTVNVPNGTSRVTLNFPVSVGTDFQLGCDASVTIDLYRNNSSVSYPYDIAGLGSVTRSSAGTAGGLNHYYFFYDWEVREPDCVSARVAVTAQVDTLPAVSAGVDLTACDGDLLTISGSGASTYTWTGGVLDAVGFNVSTIGTTTYTVTGTDGNGCQNMDAMDILVDVIPTVSAGADQTACDGDMVTLAGSGASTYVWDLGVTDLSPFATSGAGTITYTVIGTSAAGCSNTDFVDIIVNALPIIDTESALDATTCAATDGSITITASGGTGTFTYSIDGGTTYLSNGGVFTGLAVGSYQVMINDGNCPTTGSILVISGPGVPPPPTVGSTVTYCDGDALLDLNATGGAGTLNWYSDPGLITNIGTGGTLAPGASLGTTTYYVAEIVSGCEGPSSSIDVIINALPTVNAGADVSICEGDSLALSGSGANTYAWDNGISDGVSFTPGLTGTVTYLVTGTDLNSCENTDAVDVTVNVLPSVSAGADITVCVGDIATLSGTGANTYTWDNSVIDGVGFAVGTVGTTTYTVSGTDSNTCENTDQVDVIGLALPDATVSNGGLTLNAEPGLGYQWVNCDSSFAMVAGETNQAFTPSITGNYAVIVDNGSCSDTSVCENVIVNGIEPVLAYELSIFPNPSSGLFNIQFGNNDEVESVRIIDATGRLIKLISANNKSTVVVNIMEEATGLYFVIVNGNNGIQSYRLVKK